MLPKVSIIIRTKNEERWISHCLTAIFSQDFENFEVIIVDNNSTDKTVEKAKQFNVKVINIDKFLPGKALNLGINNSTGEYVCCLSAHCIPVNNKWLSNLVKNIQSEEVAGVYGRQEPLSYSSDVDKRDLLIVFGLDRKIQVKDPFFHNANSLLKRSLWDKVPFDDEATNIEDRIWATEVLKLNYKIIYEPSASVYHYHGLHQNNDIKRLESTGKMLENLDNKVLNNNLDIGKLNIVCVIPLRGEITKLNNDPLFEKTIENVLKSNHINNIVLTSENEDYFKGMEGKERIICLSRPSELSQEYIGVDKILKFSLLELEKRGILPDIVVYCDINYPLRPVNFIEDILNLLIKKGYDSVLPTTPEYKSCWNKVNGKYIRIDEGFVPSKFKQPIQIGISGLGTATYASFIRNGERLGKNIGFLEINNLIHTLNVDDINNLKLVEKIISFEDNLV